MDFETIAVNDVFIFGHSQGFLLAFGWCEGLPDGNDADGDKGKGLFVGHGGFLCW